MKTDCCHDVSMLQGDLALDHPLSFIICFETSNLNGFVAGSFQTTRLQHVLQLRFKVAIIAQYLARFGEEISEMSLSP